MNKDVQPQVYNDAVVTCACGNVFTTVSTKKTLAVEICSACHPFFTGQQKFVDTEGRIDKFAKKRKLSEEKQAQVAAQKAKKGEKTSTARGERQTLKDLLQESKSSDQ